MMLVLLLLLLLRLLLVVLVVLEDLVLQAGGMGQAGVWCSIAWHHSNARV